MRMTPEGLEHVQGIIRDYKTQEPGTNPIFHLNLSGAFFEGYGEALVEDAVSLAELKKDAAELLDGLRPFLNMLHAQLEGNGSAASAATLAIYIRQLESLAR